MTARKARAPKRLSPNARRLAQITEIRRIVQELAPEDQELLLTVVEHLADAKEFTAAHHEAEAPDNDADKLSRVSDLQQDVTELFQMADLARDLDLDKTDHTAHCERVSAVVVQVARMAGELKRGYYDALWPGQNHDAA